MTLEENLGDLTKHAGEFVRREAFTYTVLAPDSDTVIGCLYIYPSELTGVDAKIRSWVRAPTRPSIRCSIGWSWTGSPRRGRSREIEYAERRGMIGSRS